MINFLQVQFAGFGKGKVGYNKLDEVVADIDGPDLVSDFVNANRDTVVVYNTGSTLGIVSISTRGRGCSENPYLEHGVQGHTLCPERKGQEFNRVQVVHGRNQGRTADLEEEDPHNSEVRKISVPLNLHSPTGNGDSCLGDDDRD